MCNCLIAWTSEIKPYVTHNRHKPSDCHIRASSHAHSRSQTNTTVSHSVVGLYWPTLGPEVGATARRRKTSLMPPISIFFPGDGGGRMFFFENKSK